MYAYAVEYAPSPTSPPAKKRDAESNLDEFGKRYFGSNLGRFQTPDPLLTSGRPENPQTWNRYAYVLNNPLKFTDPTGLWEWAANTFASDDKKCNKQYQQNQRQRTRARERVSASSVLGTKWRRV